MYFWYYLIFNIYGFNCSNFCVCVCLCHQLNLSQQLQTTGLPVEPWVKLTPLLRRRPNSVAITSQNWVLVSELLLPPVLQVDRSVQNHQSHRGPSLPWLPGPPSHRSPGPTAAAGALVNNLIGQTGHMVVFEFGVVSTVIDKFDGESSDRWGPRFSQQWQWVC